MMFDNPKSAMKTGAEELFKHQKCIHGLIIIEKNVYVLKRRPNALK